MQDIVPGNLINRARLAFKNKPKNIQQYVSLDTSLPKIVPLQNDNKASKIMFLATQID